MSATPKFTALVLAGSRGAADPVAAAAGKSHKALVEIAGIAMLDRVLETVASSTCVGQIVVIIEDTVNLAGLPGTRKLIDAGRCRRMTSENTPARSVLAAFETCLDRLPILVVTGDHPLLTSAMVDHFCRSAYRGDVGVGLASARLVLAAYPNVVRTLISFKDGPHCGCNLYALNTIDSQRAVRFWTDVENARKRPWRIARALGIGPLLQYAFGTLSSTEAMRYASSTLGLTVTAVLMPFAEAAIDVDKLKDLELADKIIKARSATARATTT